MSNQATLEPSRAGLAADDWAGLLRQYGCGPIHFTGSDGFYERHLEFDTIKEPVDTSPREHFEAVARSIRDVLSQRWVATEKTYREKNPKRLYYLSLEFLIGRSLSNNIINLLLDKSAKSFATEKSWTGWG
jgi:starch phosphorylase